MKRRFFSILMSLSIMLSLLFVPLAVAGQEGSDSGSNAEYLQGIMNLIEDNYNFAISDRQLLEGSVKGMFTSMDDYTEFFTSEEAEKFLESVDGRYEGVGIVLTKVEDYVMITRVFPTSPAEKAGLFSGDKIARVDEVNVVGKSIDEVAGLIRGEVGSEVTLGIVRHDSEKIISITVERQGIKLNPVNYYIRDGIAYISIETFNSNTNEYLLKGLLEMEANGIEKIILDLRNNTGGEVSQAVAVARSFVPEGPITTLVFGAGNRKDIVYESSLKESKYKLVVLVNEMTASSSEILAGAIQDSGAGILVGTKTYGKARVQSLLPILTPEAYNKYAKRFSQKMLNANELISRYGVRPLNNEILGWAKITTGIYKTPAGRNIDGQGLIPDIAVEDHDLVAGIYINNIVELTRSRKPALHDEDIDVYNAEKILRISGYDVDMPDMTLDEKTYAAIKEFQKDNGLCPYGVLDFSTQDMFNRTLNKLRLEIDKQYAAAVDYLQ